MGGRADPASRHTHRTRRGSSVVGYEILVQCYRLFTHAALTTGSRRELVLTYLPNTETILPAYD